LQKIVLEGGADQLAGLFQRNNPADRKAARIERMLGGLFGK
jgi:hypothetical protein